MGLKGMVISAVSMVLGAVLYWAMTAQSSYAVQNHGFRSSTVGVILLVAGGVGFIVSLAVFLSSRRTPASPPRTLDREVVDETGRRSSVHEEQR